MDLVLSERGMPGLSPAGPAPHISPETNGLLANPPGLPGGRGCWLRSQYVHKVDKSNYRDGAEFSFYPYFPYPEVVV